MIVDIDALSLASNIHTKDLPSLLNIYLLMTGSLWFQYYGKPGEISLEDLAGHPNDDVIKATCKAFAKYNIKWIIKIGIHWKFYYKYI